MNVAECGLSNSLMKLGYPYMITPQIRFIDYSFLYYKIQILLYYKYLLLMFLCVFAGKGGDGRFAYFFVFWITHLII